MFFLNPGSFDSSCKNKYYVNLYAGEQHIQNEYLNYFDTINYIIAYLPYTLKWGYYVFICLSTHVLMYLLGSNLMQSMFNSLTHPKFLFFFNKQ